MAASLRGLIVRGPVIDGDQAFVSVGQWLGPEPPRLSCQESLARPAIRYLEGHGPANPDDLAKWSGITLGDARAAFEAASDDVRRIDGLFIGSAVKLGGSESPRTRLLGSFDPILHGWSSREMCVGGHRSVVTANGIFRPVVLSGGRVRGTWPHGNVRLGPAWWGDPERTQGMRSTVGTLRTLSATAIR